MTAPLVSRLKNSRLITAPRLAGRSNRRTRKAPSGSSHEASQSAPVCRDVPSFRSLPQPQLTAACEPPATAELARPDALGLYLREAAQVPLLTRAEETALARRVQAGDEHAREHMIRANLRLVVKIAREYENYGLPLLDLINEGNLGLMKAVERFDPEKGAKLSTYSAWWIKQGIRRALANQSRTIRLPVHVADKLHHLTRAEARLRGELGREATDDELAAQVGRRVEYITKLRRAALRPASLDAPLGHESEGTVADLVADENAGLPSEQLLKQTETKQVLELIGQLPPREASIIRLRFGLDSGTERTLEDLGREFRVTRERIRQLQNIALTKLREMMEQPVLSPVAA